MTPQRVTPMIPFDLQIHRLKTDSHFWDRVAEGRKTAELRKNDRNYKRWDYLILERIKKHEPRLYAHKTVVVQITDIVTHEEYPDGLQPGYVMLSFRKVPGEVALLIERLDNQEDNMRAAIKSTENGCAYSKELMQRELDAKDRLIDALHAQQAARIKEQESKAAEAKPIAYYQCPHCGHKYQVRTTSKRTCNGCGREFTPEVEKYREADN